MKQQIQLSPFSDNRRILNVWLSISFTGFIIFISLLFSSYFILNDQAVIKSATNYGSAEAILGIGELSGLAISAIATLRYMSLSINRRKRVFEQYISINGWSQNKAYDPDKVAGILLGSGEAYKESYSYNGKYLGHAFTCLIL